MHTDARELENNSLIEGDICIIGAGAAGISLAMEWNHQNRKVILLEGGGFQYEDKMQDLYAGKLTGQPYFPLKAIRLHYFGGTTGHWAGWCAPFEPIDFRKREWIPHSGWPITRADLDTFYERAHPYVDIGPYNYDFDFWLKQHPSWQALSTNPDKVWNKIWQFSPPTRFGEKYKAPILESKNIHLYTYANVVHLSANEQVSEIESVRIRNHTGKEHTVKAKHFILACCSVQNARILLSSRDRAPRGLGNNYDLVGRYFMEHLEMKSAELWLSKPDALPFYMMDFGQTKARAELAISEKQQEKHQILNGTASLIPLAAGRQTRPFIDLYKEDPNRTNLSQIRDTTLSAANASSTKDLAYMLHTRMEQSPNPNSRVSLENDKDALGMPRATLNWDLTDLEKRSMRKIYEILAEELGRISKGRIRLLDYLRDEKDMSWPKSTGGGWHHMGTTRMGSDPTTSVVDSNCQVHGIHNLFVAGASCFVTAAAPNPTLTLIALTIRLSDHLKKMNRIA